MLLPVFSCIMLSSFLGIVNAENNRNLNALKICKRAANLVSL